MDTSPEFGEDRFYRSGIGLSFLQHVNRGIVLLNFFLEHSVFVGAFDASYISGNEFHWVIEGLEGKNSISWEYCLESTRLEPSVVSL